MLSNEETISLLKEAKIGSDFAKEQLIVNNTPLIKSIVRRYKNKQIEYDDLVQLGTLGLLKAINNFNLDYGVRFSTYAVPMIAGEIKRFIRDDGAIKVSRSIKATTLAINRYIEEYRHNFSKEPTVSEIALAFNLEPHEVVFNLESSHYPLSIHQENDEDGLTLEDRIEGKSTIEDTIDKMLLKELLENLEPRDKKIIILRYYRDKTQQEIAKILGVSQVQVSRLENKIIETMRKQFLGKSKIN